MQKMYFYKRVASRSRYFKRNQQLAPIVKNKIVFYFIFKAVSLMFASVTITRNRSDDTVH